LVIVWVLAAPLAVYGGEGSEDMEDEGSGGFDFLSPGADDEEFDYEIHLSQEENGDRFYSPGQLDDLDDLEYYDELYPKDYDDFLENYDDEPADYYDYSDISALDGEDSVLRIEDELEVNDIEIRPKPEAGEEGEEILLETSQIFIMVGSACVSFAIFMLTFFLCRRMVAKKEEKKKKIPFTITPDRRSLKESSIVKDYHKVPTTTKQFLQNSHIEMYRGGGDTKHPEIPPSAPLVQ